MIFLRANENAERMNLHKHFEDKSYESREMVGWVVGWVEVRVRVD